MADKMAPWCPVSHIDIKQIGLNILSERNIDGLMSNDIFFLYIVFALLYFKLYNNKNSSYKRH